MKKGFIAFGIVNTIAVFLSLYTFAMSTNSGGNVNDDPFDMENITEVKKAPEDGSSPSDYSILENIQYASGYLYYNRNWKAVTSGGVVSNAGVKVTQEVNNVRIVDKNYMYQEAVSYSSMVKVATQKFYQPTGKKVFLLQGSPKSIDNVTWGTKVNTVDYQYIYSNYGFLPDQLNSYYYSEESILDTSSIEENEGIYTLHVDLNELGAINSRREVVTMGGALDNPVYTEIHADITLDRNWKVLSIATDESYSIKKNIGIGVVNASCDSSLNETFEYGVTIGENVVGFYRDYFNTSVGGDPIIDEEKTALTYLQSMGSVVAGRNNFNIDVGVNGRKMHGQVELNLANKEEVNVNLEDKYFIKYYDGSVYTDLDGLNLSVDEQYIQQMIASLLSKISENEGKAEIETPSDYGELLDQIMENITLTTENDRAVVNLFADYQGVSFAVDLTFDEEDLYLIGMDGFFQYGDARVDIAVDATKDYEGKDIIDDDFSDLSNSIWLIDRLLSIDRYAGYALSGDYDYQGIHFHVQADVSKQGNADIVLSFSDNQKEKEIDVTKIGNNYFVEFGNIKVKADRDSLNGVWEKISEQIRKETDGDAVLEGISFGSFAVSNLQTDEKGDLYLTFRTGEKTYLAEIYQGEEDALLFAVPELDLTFEIREFGGEISEPESVDYLDEKDLDLFLSLFDECENLIVSEKYYAEFRSAASNDENSSGLVSFQRDGDKELLDVKSEGNFAFDFRLYRDGDLCYVDATYEGIRLSFTLSAAEVHSLERTIVDTLEAYYGVDFAVELQNRLNEFYAENDISFVDAVKFLLENDCEENLSLSTNGVDEIVVSYLDSLRFVVRLDAEISFSGSISDCAFAGTIGAREWTYSLDESVYYTPIENVQNLSFALDAYLTMKDFVGYRFEGNLEYRDLNGAMQLFVDRNGNFSLEGTIASESGEKTLLLVVVDESAYLIHGNLQVKVSREEAVQVFVDALREIGKSPIDEEELLSLIRELNLLIESVTIEESDLITKFHLNEKYYEIQFADIGNREYLLSCGNESVDFSLKVAEYKGEIAYEEQGEYLSSDQIRALVSDLRKNEERIFSGNFKGEFSFENAEYLLTGSLSASGDFYRVDFTLNCGGETVLAEIVVREKIYAIVRYSDTCAAFTLERTECVGLAETIAGLIREEISSETVSFTEEDILGFVKKIIADDSEYKATIAYSEGVCISYDRAEIRLNADGFAYDDLSSHFRWNWTENDDDYAVDLSVSYCEVAGIDQALVWVRAAKEMANFAGFRIDGSAEAEGIVVEFHALIDEFRRAKVEVTFTYNQVSHEVTLFYVGEEIAVHFGNIDFLLSEEEWKQVLSELRKDQSGANSSTDVGMKMIEMLQKIDLTMSSIRISPSSLFVGTGIGETDFVFSLEYENRVLTLSCLDFFQTHLEIGESSEKVPEIDKNIDYLGAADIVCLADMAKRVQNGIVSENLFVGIDLDFAQGESALNLSGTLLYRNSEEFYAAWTTSGAADTQIEIYKRNAMIYLDVTYSDYRISLKYESSGESDAILVRSLENAFKVLDARFDLGLFERFFPADSSSEARPIDAVKKILEGDYEDILYVYRNENGYRFVFDGNELTVGENDEGISVDFETSGFGGSLIFDDRRDCTIDKLLDHSYTLIAVDADFSSWTETLLGVLDYQGYLAELHLCYSDLDVHCEAAVDGEKNVALNVEVIYQNATHRFEFAFADEKIYFSYGAVRAVLNESELPTLIAEIKALIGAETSNESATKNADQTVKAIGDWITALRLGDKEMLLDFLFDGTGYQLKVNATEEGISFSSDWNDLSGMLCELKTPILIDESGEFLSGDDLKLVIAYAQEAKDYFFEDRGYLHLNGRFDDETTCYDVSASARYDYTDRDMAKLVMQLDVDSTTNGKTIKMIDGTISYQNNLIYLDLTYNELYGLHFYVDKLDASKAIDVVLTKLAQGPFNNGAYGLNLELMKGIKEILELDPSVILDFDDQGAFDSEEASGPESAIRMFKQILSLRIDENLNLSVSEDSVSMRWGNYFDGVLSHYLSNENTYICVEGEGNFRGWNYSARVAFDEYQEFEIDGSRCVYFENLESLANGAMNTINVSKYDVTGTLKIQILLSSFTMKVDNLLIKLDENGTASGYVKTTTPKITGLTSSSPIGETVAYIYLCEDGNVYLRREYEIREWQTWMLVKKSVTEYKSYPSQKEFFKDFLNVFIWITQLKESVIDSFSGASLAQKYSDLVTAYNVSESGESLNYKLTMNLACLAEIFDDGTTLDFVLNRNEKEYYLDSLKIGASIYKVLSLNGDFKLNSFGEDFSYEEKGMPSLSEMKGQ